MAEGLERPSTVAKGGGANGRLRIILAIARKDIGESLRNSQLLLLSALPIILFLLYHLMVSGINQSRILDVAVYDAGSSQLVVAMQQDEMVRVHLVESEAALQARIEEQGMSGLFLPSHFDEAVLAGERPVFTVWLNVQNGLEEEILAWQRALEAALLRLGQQSLPAQVEWVSVANGGVGSRLSELTNYLLMVILMLVLFMTAAHLVAMLIAEEKERKTAVMLAMSPAQIYDIVWGKLLAALVHVAAVLAVVILINGGLAGNWLLVLLYLLSGLIAGMSIGLLAGSFSQSAKQCSSWLGLLMILLLTPTWFLTLLKLPEPFHSLIRAIPTQLMATGLNDALNGVALADDRNLWLWLLFVLAVTAVAMWRIGHKPESMIV